MLPDAPPYLNLAFVGTTLATIVMFFDAIRRSPSHGSKAGIITGGILAFAVIQTLVALSGFYQQTETVPPRLVLLAAPSLLVILVVFLTKGGRAFVDSLPLRALTLLSVVRIPVEFCLYWLFLAKAVPELMTFAGRNFDIIAGLSAPLVYSFAFKKDSRNDRMLLIWNVVSLILLLFIVVNAVLSAPTNFQQFAFDQPNIAILHWPFSLLPAIVVPIVLFTHLVSLRRLLSR